MLFLILVFIHAINAQHCENNEKPVLVFTTSDKTPSNEFKLRYQILNTNNKKWQNHIIQRYTPKSIICVSIGKDLKGNNAWDCQTKNKFHPEIIWNEHTIHCSDEQDYESCRITINIQMSPKGMMRVRKDTHQPPIIIVYLFVGMFMTALIIMMYFICCGPR